LVVYGVENIDNAKVRARRMPLSGQKALNRGVDKGTAILEVD